MISDSERFRGSGGGGGRGRRDVNASSMARGQRMESPIVASPPTMRASWRPEIRDSTPLHHRSQSLEPSREATHQYLKRSDIRSSDRCGRSRASGHLTPATNVGSLSRRISKPTRKIGCLGSSSNMTRHLARDGFEEGTDTKDEDRQMMKLFEMEMRMKRSNPEKTSLSNRRSSAAVCSRGKSSRVRSVCRGHSDQTQNSPTWQQHEGRQHNGEEIHHQSPSSDTSQIVLTEFSNEIPPSSCVIDTRLSLVEGTGGNFRTLSRGRRPQCSASNDYIYREPLLANHTTGTSSSLRTETPHFYDHNEDLIHRHGNRRHHHHRCATDVDTRMVKSSTQSIKSRSSSAGKTAESIYTKDTEALTDSTIFCRIDSITERALGISPSNQKELDDDAADYIAYLTSRAAPCRAPTVNELHDNTGATPERTYYREVSSLGHANETIRTNLCNDKGRCVRHPHVQLRKKKITGGWNVLIANCPECCVEEMRRLKRLQTKISKSKSAASDCPRMKGDCSNTGYSRNLKLKQMNPTSKVHKSFAENTSVRSGRSKSCSSCRRDTTAVRRRLSSSSHNHRERLYFSSMRDNAVPMFEFDIALDAYGNIITSPRFMMRSSKSPSLKESPTVKSIMSAKSTRSRSCKSTCTPNRAVIPTRDRNNRRKQHRRG